MLNENAVITQRPRKLSKQKAKSYKNYSL